MIRTDSEVISLMQQLGEQRSTEKFQEMREKGTYSRTSPGAFLIGSMAGRLEEAVSTWMGTVKRGRNVVNGQPVLRLRIAEALKQIGLEKACLMASRYVVEELMKEKRGLGVDRHKLRAGLGCALHSEMRMSEAADAAPEKFKYVRKYLAGPGAAKHRRIFNFLVDELDPEERSSVYCWEPIVQDGVAMVLLVFLVKTSGIMDTYTVAKRKYRREVRVVLKPSTLDWAREMEETARSVAPVNLALTSQPVPWISLTDGGYPEDFVGKRPLMSSRVNKHLRAFAESDCPEVYSAVNSLQRTAWEINPHVLEVFRTAVEGGWGEENLKVPVREPRVCPPKPDVPKDSETYRIWRREYRHYKTQEGRDYADTLRCARLLYLADFYGDGPLYYVHMLDFRGRCYPLAGSLQYQGDDRQRGLLRFRESKPIPPGPAEEWFWIHGANCWGEDKVPFADRLCWAKLNLPSIISVGQDPIDNRWWTEADKPWQFLAWCLEAAEFVEDKKNFQSKIPVGMDGSNNGLQLYSLLLRDPVGGRATNCSPSERPQDIYMDVAALANAEFARVSQDMAADPLQRKWCRQLLDYWPEGLPRSAVKRPVMTLPYGATHFSCQHYIADWYHEEVRGKRLNPPPFPDLDAHEAMTYFGGVVWGKVKETVIAAFSAMEWLREISDRAASLGKSIEWVTPTGLKVVQTYRKGRKKLVVMSIGKPMTYWFPNPTPHIDKPKSRNGLCPNFIHSLDASLMCKVTNRLTGMGVGSLMMIHDSFATHAHDAPLMARVVRDEAVMMFSGNLLEGFRNQVQDQLGVPIPPPPPQGELDITQLSHAKYFFA
jgi:DNA-directed RNA polymerase